MSGDCASQVTVCEYQGTSGEGFPQAIEDSAVTLPLSWQLLREAALSCLEEQMVAWWALVDLEAGKAALGLVAPAS